MSIYFSHTLRKYHVALQNYNFNVMLKCVNPSRTKQYELKGKGKVLLLEVYNAKPLLW